ncbi:MAG: phosphoenolpyruvate--protein phosphotransferase [Lachnospiraceae bacterium]|jgi:phosphotransferase system enzyme I (PtsI)|nr:phosphoenolpyruvate--protein phosphotransferase [Lachnospiraceae bacterium]
MRVLSGKAAFKGVAIGKIKEFGAKKVEVNKTTVSDVEAEIARFEAAKETASAQLGSLYEKAVAEVGEENAAIFEVHQMMLEDEDYLDGIKGMIRDEQVNAEYAVSVNGQNFSDIFASMDDDYMKERAADVKDISARVVRILAGVEEGGAAMEEPSILVAEDLAPSETLQLDRSKVLAFVTRKGSTNSHTAILARTMNIPALVMVSEAEHVDGLMGIVDGKEGKLIVEPDEETIKSYQDKLEAQKKEQELLNALKGKPSVTKDGRKVNLYANIGGVEDAEAALANDAEGIGLFRSEFLYLQSNDFPTEEEQFEAYKAVAEKMEGKRVIIRTLDIGADKQIGYFGLDKEENPALGYRAVRICLNKREVFRTQLRALCRASAYGRIAIMVPMIISVWEVQTVKKILAKIREELLEEGKEVGEIEFGIMIETPASVIIADELAKEVDFFSIGTNDLTQYTLAIDRQNAKLDMFYNAHHPAILRMIKMVVDAAHKEGIWAGICGELGADTTLTEEFVNMGVDELSVSPAMILPVRNKVVNM